MSEESYKMADVDDLLLQQLTEEEIEELSELIDPDVRSVCVCASEICNHQSMQLRAALLTIKCAHAH